MKKSILLVAVLIAAMIVPQAVRAYDFSKTVSSGQTLYFNIKSGNTVEVTYPGTTNYYTNGNKPTGSLTIPQTVSWNGTTYTVTGIGRCAFYNCDGLTSVTIPYSVTSIGNWAFYVCDGLTGTINLPSNLTSIGIGAFRACTNITKVNFPVGLTTIEEQAFAECHSLTNPVFATTGQLTTIGAEAFYHCPAITTITIPSNVTSIGTRAFKNCTGATALYYSAANCSYIGDNAFSGCSNLHTLRIYDYTAIPEDAFNSCDNLTTVDYYATGTAAMGTSANPLFDGFSNLTLLRLYTSVQSLPAYAFKNCTSLTQVLTYGSGYQLQTIGASAFEGCDALTSVTLPNTVTTIGNHAFQNCTQMEEITVFCSTPPSLGAEAFLNLPQPHHRIGAY